MSVTSFNIPGVLGASYTLSENGRVRSAQSLNDSRLDRSFTWDHMGRIVRSVTTGSPFQFEQNYGYDEYDNMTSREGRYWNTSNTNLTATYSRERAVSSREQSAEAGTPTHDRSFQYDAMGNTTQVVTTVTVNGQSGSPTTENRQYDAMGRMIATGKEVDGYGRVVKENQNYNLISTPFGGQVLTILDGGGQKTKGRVYVGTDLLAEQVMMSGQPSEVVWRHRDPMNTASRDAKSGGWTGQLYMVDPLGTMLAPTGSSGISAEGKGQASGALRLPGGGAKTNSEGNFYTPNWGTYFSSGGFPGQYGGGCGAFAPASVSCGSQMDLFNHMSREMLEGYARYAQTLVEAGFFKSMSPLGQEVLASSFAGVTAAGVGGTYTLKPNYKITGSDGPQIFRELTGFDLVLVPGGAPDTTGGGGQQGGSGGSTQQDEHRRKEEQGFYEAGRRLSGPCNDFYEALIQDAADIARLEYPNGKLGFRPPFEGASTYVLNLYWDAMKENRVSNSGRSGVTSQDDRSTNITYGVTTNFSRVSWNNEFYDLSVGDRGLHTLHEALHQVAGFTDRVLAEAAQRITRGPAIGKQDPSKYLNDRIAEKCR